MHIQTIAYTTALLFLAVVVATDFYITSPYDRVEWRAGKPAKITWDIIPGGPEISSISIDLMDGDGRNAHVIQPIASGVSPDATSCEWAVPSNFPSTGTVFIRVKGQGGESDVHRFSHRFTIQGGSAPPQESQPPQRPTKISEAAVSSSILTVQQQASQTSMSTSTNSDITTTTTSNLPTETNSIPSVTVPTTRYRKNDAASKSNDILLPVLLSLVFLLM